jgi:metallo-beta-lactamase family protein
MTDKIQFLGAAGTVTGSKTLLQIQHKRLLIDCGLFQGLKVLRLRNWQAQAELTKNLDAVILTHAHIDHSGLIPLLVKEGFHKKIYCTKATQALCAILLPDAGHLQEEDANFANRHKFSKHHPALPLFTKEDALRSLDYFSGVDWNKPLELNKSLTVTFKRAGHILGASLVQVNASGKIVTFSGDLGREDSILLPPPETIQNTDYLVVESTYGNRAHSSNDALTFLADVINQTSKRGGTVLIPAFAVGRAQEILYLIHLLKQSGRIGEIPVYLNSPMAVDSTYAVQYFKKEGGRRRNSVCGQRNGDSFRKF